MSADRVSDSADRAYDIVLFGATGFTGGLTADYLARNAGPGTRWALAGRNRAKLEALRARLAEADPRLADLPLLHADVTEPDSLREVAAATRVVITTVGPYIHYGEPLVAACADAGTDYVDLTGEPEFVDLMYLRHHARAVETGARLVHACGFDSIPYDLGVHFTVQRLPEDVPLHVDGYVRAYGTFSGGTAHSALTAMSRGRQTARAARERRQAEPRPEGRRISGRAGRAHRSRGAGGWALPMPTLDPVVVRRSAAALERYGPDFTYRHHYVVKRMISALGIAGAVLALTVLAQIPPARAALLRRAAPGDGPSPERRAKSWFSVRFVGEGGGRRVVTGVSGGDPGYGETAKMLAESALCLAHDELPATAGQVTTAAAMGDALIRRLQEAGIAFTVLDS
jgi:short subunit dehydrogenase-like uncharacterized protein